MFYFLILKDVIKSRYNFLLKTIHECQLHQKLIPTIQSVVNAMSGDYATCKEKKISSLYHM